MPILSWFINFIFTKTIIAIKTLIGLSSFNSIVGLIHNTKSGLKIIQ